MRVKCEGIQSPVFGGRLHHLLKHAPQDIARIRIPLPETHPYRAVLLIARVVNQYAHLIAGVEIAQRIFKQFVHSVVKI